MKKEKPSVRDFNIVDKFIDLNSDIEDKVRRSWGRILKYYCTKEEGEIELKFFKVYRSMATNQGVMFEGVKYFKDLASARKYALKLVEELKKDSKYSDDPDTVEIENEKMELIECWINDQGVKHYETLNLENLKKKDLVFLKKK